MAAAVDGREVEFDFSKREGSDSSLGDYLRSVFGSSTSAVPEAIQNQFSNTSPVPPNLNVSATPKPDGFADRAARGGAMPIPKELISAVEPAAEAAQDKEGEKSTAFNEETSKMASESPSATPSPSDTSTSSSSHGGNSMQIVSACADVGQRYCDITEYLTQPQKLAAQKLGLPPSTLSKRWKEAVRERKWPWRTVNKIDKEITTLLHNIPPGGPIPPDIEKQLGVLLQKRQDELRPVVIRL